MTRSIADPPLTCRDCIVYNDNMEHRQHDELIPTKPIRTRQTGLRQEGHLDDGVLKWWTTLQSGEVEMVACQECNGEGCDWCGDKGTLPSMSSLLKWRDAVAGEEHYCRSRIDHFTSTRKVFMGENFERWMKEIGRQVFRDWFALSVGGQSVWPHGIGIHGRLVDDTLAKVIGDMEAKGLHLEEEEIEELQSPLDVFDRTQHGGLVVAVIVSEGPMESADVDALRAQAFENCTRGVELAEEDLLEAMYKLDDLNRAIEGLKELRHVRKTMKRIHEELHREDIPVKEMAQHICGECGKPAAAMDDDGNWYCKKHAYPMGLLDRPKVEEEPVDIVEDIAAEVDIEESSADWEPGIPVEKLPANLRRRLGR